MTALDILANLSHGFAVSCTPVNLFYCFAGVLAGTVVGILPGIGTVGAIALLLPFASDLTPTASLILFCGIYFGSKYGGSTTSILMNVPGEPASIITCIDGYAMAQRGRAGAALAICAIGSFIAGTLGLVALTLFAPPLAELMLYLGPQEQFTLVLTGIIIFTKMAGRSPSKTVLLALVGAIIGTIGQNFLSGLSRFSYGYEELERGIDLSLVAMGLFGISEILTAMTSPDPPSKPKTVRARELYPTREEYRRSSGPILRGGLLGFFIGLLPGPATTISTFASYSLEKKLSKNASEFGHGAIEGVAGPESANNAAVSGTMVPTLALGLPFCGTTAIILSGLMIHGVMPGPALVTQHSDIFWGVIASMYLGNVILLLFNYPLVLLLVQILRIPPSIFMPLVLTLTLTGAYLINHSLFDLVLVIAFGILGFLFNRADFELSPLIIGIVMAPEVERRLVQTLALGQGTFWDLLSRPLSLTFLFIGFLLVLFTLCPDLCQRLLRRKPLASSEK